MSEHLGFNPEEEANNEKEEITLEKVREVVHFYQLPEDYREELEAFDDVNELIATASLWIKEEGYDIDEFLAKIGS